MNKIRIKIQTPSDPGNPDNLYDQNWRGRLYVDGAVVDRDLSIDYIALAKSAIVGGEHFILTCSCGHAPCARLDDPIQVSHEGGRIFWHVRDPLPERWFEFSKDEYASSILDVLRKAQAEVPRPEEEIEFPFGYYGFCSSHLDWCVKTLESGVIVGTGYEDP